MKMRKYVGDEVMNRIISALITTRHYHFKVARLTENIYIQYGAPESMNRVHKHTVLIYISARLRYSL